MQSKFQNMLKTALVAIFCLISFGCKEYPKEIDPIDISDPSDGTPQPTLEPIENPVCTELMGASDGANGFLWKPEGDNSGKLVVLLPARFKLQFDSVSVTKATGQSEGLSFTGFSNGDRQTWRGSLPGARYKDQGLIQAQEFKQICTWQLPGAARRRHD